MNISLYLLNDDNDRDNLLKIIKEIAKDYGECIYSSFEKLATDDDVSVYLKKWVLKIAELLIYSIPMNQ